MIKNSITFLLVILFFTCNALYSDANTPRGSVSELRYWRNGYDRGLINVTQTAIIRNDTLWIVNKYENNDIDTIATCEINKRYDNFICLSSIGYYDAVFKDSLKVYHPRPIQDSTIIDINFPKLEDSITLTVEYRYNDKSHRLPPQIAQEEFYLDHRNRRCRLSKNLNIEHFWLYIKPNLYFPDNLHGGYYGLLIYPSSISPAIDLFGQNLYIELPRVSSKLFNGWYMYHDYALLTDALFEWHDMKFTRVIHDDPDHASTANGFYDE